jgi:hypothetical protein
MSLRRGSKNRWADLATPAALTMYLTVALAISPQRYEYAWGHPWDLQHVPFGWVYFLMAAWTFGRAAQWTLRRAPTLGRWSVPIAMAMLLPAAWQGRTLPEGMADLYWSHTPAPKGLVEAARYIRSHARPAELIQDSEDDPCYLVECLAEHRAWVGWTVVASYTAKTAVDAIFQQRIKEHAQWRDASTADELRQWAQKTRVRWYLLHPETKVAWPREFLAHPVYEKDGYRVYDLSSLSGG